MPSQKSLPRRIPFYFAARTRPCHTPTIRSASQELEAQQTEDLNAHDLLPAQLRKLKQDLELYNNLGQMVTFCTVLKDWVFWNRYVHFHCHLFWHFRNFETILEQAPPCPQDETWCLGTCCS